MQSVAVASAPAAKTTPPAVRGWTGPLVAWGVWAVMTAGTLGFVALYGSNVPFYDDWDLVDRLTGVKPVSWSWLWELHNSHRLPVPKLLALGLFRLTGVDFRAEMFLDVALLSGLAAALIGTVRRVRGWTSVTDAFFPLLLLHWGLCRVLLWGWQMHVILAMVLPAVPLLVMVRQRSQPPLPWVLLAWGCVVLLPLCGANGLAFVPALAWWLGYLAVASWQGPNPRPLRGLLVGGLAVSAMLLVPLHYLVQYEKEDSVLPFSARAAAATTVKFLTLNFGPTAQAWWPWSGATVLGLLFASGLVLVANVLRRRTAGARPPAGRAGYAGVVDGSERPRALGLLFFLGGIAGLAVGFGTGRSYRGNVLEEHWVNHYWIFAVPAFYFVYLAWVVYGPRRLRPLVTGLLCTFQLLILPYTTAKGLAYGRDMRAHVAAFEHDLRRGEPAFALASRYANTLCPTQTQYTAQVQDDLARRMRELHRAGIGLFQYLREDPPFREVGVPVAPSAVYEGTWEEGVFRAEPADAYVEFTLPEARSVYAIRLRYSYVNTKQMFSELRAGWKRTPGDPFPAEPQYSFLVYTPWAVLSREGTGPDVGDNPVNVAVQDTVAGFRLYPASKGPCGFKIEAITLWVPPEAPAPAPAQAPQGEAGRQNN